MRRPQQTVAQRRRPARLRVRGHLLPAHHRQRAQSGYRLVLILDTEWPAIRANFETWLAPDNFDTDGKQIRSLGEMNRALRSG